MLSNYKNIAMVVVLAGLTACHNVPVWQQGMFDGPIDGQEHPPLYVTGWKDGCETGAASSATYLYRMRYNFRQDWKLAQNDIYHKGWKDAYDYCRKYILQHNLSTMGKKDIWKNL